MAKGIDTSKMVADALARGVQVKRVAAGERVIDETVFARKRGDRLVATLRNEDNLIRERPVVNEGTSQEHCRNGLGEWIY